MKKASFALSKSFSDANKTESTLLFYTIKGVSLISKYFNHVNVSLR